jgi:hypothetical protein
MQAFYPVVSRRPDNTGHNRYAANTDMGLITPVPVFLNSGCVNTVMFVFGGI